MIICKLIPKDSSIPNLLLNDDNDSLVIGRNRQCQIRDKNCPKNYCKVKLLSNEKQLFIEYLNDNKVIKMKSGETLKGPGFSYRIKIVSSSDKSAGDSNSATNGQSNNQIDDAVQWSEIENGSVLIGSFFNGIHCHSDKIAAFDYDFTLFTTKSGKSFPTDENDYKLFDKKLPKIIENLIQKQSYRFVIFSNQLGISKGKTSKSSVQKRFENSILESFKNLPCLIMIATTDDIYRKPCVGLWNYLVEKINRTSSDKPISFDHCFYVGDAAGRPKTALRKADFSASDLMFTKNIGIKFFTPENFIDHIRKYNQINHEHFSQKQHVSLPEKCFQINLKEFSNDHLLINRFTNEKIYDLKQILPEQKHCIIFCGISGTGKTTFYENHLQNLSYKHINMDRLKSMAKCESLLKQSAANNDNIVIDNTNLEQKQRQKWIDLCRANNYNHIIIFIFQLQLKHIFHNNKYRQLTGLNKSVSDVVIYTQNKKYEDIDKNECDQQFLVNFRPKFNDKNNEQLYQMLLIEK